MVENLQQVCAHRNRSNSIEERCSLSHPRFVAPQLYKPGLRRRPDMTKGEATDLLAVVLGDWG